MIEKWIRICSNADACTHNAEPHLAINFLHAGKESHRNRCQFDVACTFDEYCELIAAQPRHDIVGTQRLPETLGHQYQKLVADAVAERVVHVLESVEIKVNERDRGGRLDGRR